MYQIPENLKPTIRKLQATLTKIDQKIPCFFNITQFQNMGLVKSRKIYCINTAGNKEVFKHEYYLTDKARQILNVMI